MTRLEALALHLFGQLTDPNRTRSELELIEAALQEAYENGRSMTSGVEG